MCWVIMHVDYFISEDIDITIPDTPRTHKTYEDRYTRPRKSLAENAGNVIFYHLRGVSTPRT